VIHPIPPGTRDVLPDEMRELRELTGTLHDVFSRAGYGEIWTPTMEYEDVLRRGDERAAGAGYRLFDEHGQVLVLRSDMTIPIAGGVSPRRSTSPTPTARWTAAAARHASSSRVGSSSSACRSHTGMPRWWP
jgi:ATP phosphoribosyltransferase regulatory subunit